MIGFRRHLSVLLAAALPAALAAAGPPAGPPNLLFITLDTTRADHLGCYGDKAARTTVLDDLAASGALFEEAHTHVPLTLPSHATLFTGRLPSSFDLRVNGLTLREGTPTLATILRSRGFWTGAVVSSVILERHRGLAQGFDVYDDHMTLAPRRGGPPEERPADQTTRAALDAVARTQKPFFLWVHYYDPHYEYRPPEPYASAFAKSPYDGEIAYMDAAIGRLLDGLRKQGRLRDTLVVVAGDHGESLGAHGEEQHGVFLYECTLHVPLIMAWPGHIPEGVRVRDLCGLDSVAPTVLDLMGFKPQGMDGASLRGTLAGGPPPSGPVYIESYQGYFTYGWAPLRGIMDGRWKFIQAPKPEVYEWRTSEQKNLYSPGAPEVARATADLSRYPAADTAERGEMERFLKDPSNAETLRQLASLGYLAGGGFRPDAPGLLDPKDAIGIEAELRNADQLLGTGEGAKGEALLLGVLKRNPQNVPALSMLGIHYLDAGQVEKAELCFAEEVKLKPQMDTAHLNLGTAYKRMGRADKAEKEYRAALALSPAMPEAVSSLAQVLIAQGRNAEARKLLAEAFADGVESADSYFESGVLEASDAHWEKARFAFSKVLSLDPRRHEAMANLGRIAFREGKVDEAVAQYQRALRLAPKNASYLATLGSLYLNGKDDPAQALQYFQRALAADPYGPEAANLKELIAGLRTAQE